MGWPARRPTPAAKARGGAGIWGGVFVDNDDTASPSNRLTRTLSSPLSTSTRLFANVERPIKLSSTEGPPVTGHDGLLRQGLDGYLSVKPKRRFLHEDVYVRRHGSGAPSIPGGKCVFRRPMSALIRQAAANVLQISLNLVPHASDQTFFLSYVMQWSPFRSRWRAPTARRHEATPHSPPAVPANASTSTSRDRPRTAAAYSTTFGSLRRAGRDCAAAGCNHRTPDVVVGGALRGSRSQNLRG